MILGRPGTTPPNLPIKTFPVSSDGIVYLGGYEIAIEDFLTAVEYVLTNTDLYPKDPRLQFLKKIQSMKETEGYNPKNKRLKSSELPE